MGDAVVGDAMGVKYYDPAVWHRDTWKFRRAEREFQIEIAQRALNDVLEDESRARQFSRMVSLAQSSGKGDVPTLPEVTFSALPGCSNPFTIGTYHLSLLGDTNYVFIRSVSSSARPGCEKNNFPNYPLSIVSKLSQLTLVLLLRSWKRARKETMDTHSRKRKQR